MPPSNEYLNALQGISNGLQNNAYIELLKTGVISFFVALVSGFLAWYTTRANTRRGQIDAIAQQLLGEISSKLSDLSIDILSYMDANDRVRERSIKLTLKILANLVEQTRSLGELRTFNKLKANIDHYHQSFSDMRRLLLGEPFGKQNGEYDTDLRVEISNAVQSLQRETYQLRLNLLQV